MDPLTKTTIENLDNPEIRKVLILGGGFGGVKAALELAGQYKFQVTLISDQINFRYYPMLYRTATGGSRDTSSIPLREIFSERNIELVQGTALTLDRAKKTVKTESGKGYPFDTLIVGLGSVTNYFGIKGLREYSYGIKSIEDAQQLRDHLHQQLLDEHQPDINYIIVGGGPTGVELAGALPGYIKHIMKKHGLPPRRFNVDIIEAEKRLLPRMSPRYSRAVSKRLRRLGVKQYLGQKVLAETAQSLKISGKTLSSETVVWTAGVTTNPFMATNGFKLDDRGKAIVNENLQAEPDIYVIGDNASTQYSGMAQTALRDGSCVASLLKGRASGKKVAAYQPKKPIYITPVGRRWAAVAWRRWQFFGLFGWMMRRAAEFVGYHDLEVWWRASRRWMAEADSEESCPVCYDR